MDLAVDRFQLKVQAQILEKSACPSSCESPLEIAGAFMFNDWQLWMQLPSVAKKFSHRQECAPILIKERWCCKKLLTPLLAKKFQICSLHICQNLYDVKAKLQLELWALLPIAFWIANCWTRKLSQNGQRTDFAYSSALHSLMTTIEWHHIQPDLS
jgi:hypothetical protein